MNPVIRVGGGYRRLSWKVMNMFLLKLEHCEMQFQGFDLLNGHGI